MQRACAMNQVGDSVARKWERPLIIPRIRCKWCAGQGNVCGGCLRRLRRGGIAPPFGMAGGGALSATAGERTARNVNGGRLRRLRRGSIAPPFRHGWGGGALFRLHGERAAWFPSGGALSATAGERAACCLRRWPGWHHGPYGVKVRPACGNRASISPRLTSSSKKGKERNKQQHNSSSNIQTAA